MTLVTKGGKMKREEKKKWLKARKDRIKLNFECGGIDCGYCPFLGTLCGINKEVADLFGEVWAEENGYVKKEDLHPKVNEEFLDGLVALLDRWGNYSAVKNTMDCEAEYWMDHPDQEDNWYRWLKENLFVEDTEKDVNDLTYTPSKPDKYTDNDSNPIPPELSSISCVVKIKDKWDYLKDTLKVIYEQEACISKKDAYKKVIKIMEEYEA